VSLILFCPTFLGCYTRVLLITNVEYGYQTHFTKWTFVLLVLHRSAFLGRGTRVGLSVVDLENDHQTHCRTWTIVLFMLFSTVVVGYVIYRVG
jgi:hypothetical protein